MSGARLVGNCLEYYIGMEEWKGHIPYRLISVAHWKLACPTCYVVASVYHESSPARRSSWNRESRWLLSES